MWSNFHSHCNYCDGKQPLETHVRAAISQNIKILGFSSHAPLPFDCEWCIQPDKSSHEKDTTKTSSIESYISEIHRLKNKYRDQITIHTGLEVDFIPDVISTRSTEIQFLPLDYTIGSIHFLGTDDLGTPWTLDYDKDDFEHALKTRFNNNLEQLIYEYYKLIQDMVLTAPPTIIGHLDLIRKNAQYNPAFDENAAWHRTIIEQTIDVIAHSDCIVEVNTGGKSRGWIDDYYPSQQTLELCYEAGIPITINSDSHHPDNLSFEFPDAADQLYTLGYRELSVLIDETWQSVPFTTRGLTQTEKTRLF